jgi:PHD/YefM family antitoxin component YafN of YafNO toxin-antitoxin module
MRIYTYSQARNRLAEILEESKREEVVIRRRRGDQFSIIPKPRSQRSPFSVPSLGKTVSRTEILAALRESRRQSDRLRRVKRNGRPAG